MEGPDFLTSEVWFHTHTQRLIQHYLIQSKVSEIVPFAGDIEGLCIFSFLDSDFVINELKYLAMAEDI